MRVKLVMRKNMVSVLTSRHLIGLLPNLVFCDKIIRLFLNILPNQIWDDWLSTFPVISNYIN